MGRSTSGTRVAGHRGVDSAAGYGACHEDPYPKAPMSEPATTPVPYDPAVEHADSDERQTVADIDATSSTIREKTFQDTGHAMRSVHVESRGTMRATVIVEPGLSDRLAPSARDFLGNLRRLAATTGRDTQARPYVTVARVVAEPQTAWSDALATVVDDGMFFSPWRGLAEHQPLGDVMRARRIAYEHSAPFRAARDGRPVVEPRDLTGWPA